MRIKKFNENNTIITELTIEDISWLLEGIIQNDFEWNGKSYIINDYYLEFVKRYLNVSADVNEMIKNVFGLEILNLNKYNIINEHKFEFRGYFNNNDIKYTFTGRFDDDFFIETVCESKNDNLSNSLMNEIEYLKRKFSIDKKELKRVILK